MFCKKCGIEIKDGARFCPVCGENQGNMEERTEGKGKMLGGIAIGALKLAGSLAVTVGAVALQEPIKEVTKGVADGLSEKIIGQMKDKGWIKKTLWDKAKDVPGKVFKK